MAAVPKVSVSAAPKAAPKAAGTADKIVSTTAAVRDVAPKGGAGKKPSTTGKVAGGAAAGAATGATLGSIVPGVGTAIGAGAGAVVGGTAGAVKGHSAKKAWRKANAGSGFNGKKLLITEFMICIVILALSPLTDKHKEEGPGAFMKRGSAVCALFLILSLIASASNGAAKVASAFGGIVCVSLLVSNRDIFVVLAEKFNAKDDKTVDQGDDGPSAGSIVGSVGGASVLGNAGLEPAAYTPPAGNSFAAGLNPDVARTILDAIGWKGRTV